MQEKCKQMIKDDDIGELKKHLSRTSKYKFVIDAVDKHLPTSHLLEIGCSRGHLTSYFIASGYKVIGSDVSPQAVSDAKGAFGDFFVTANSPRIQAGRHTTLFTMLEP